MGNVIPFHDYKPTAGELPWTTVQIYEAPVTADTGEPGSYTMIDTQAVPAYPDPMDPPYMDFITYNGTQIPAWYYLKFLKTGAEEATPPLLFRGSGSFRPTTKQVAAHIKNRTVDNNNNFLGDFTTNTSVTADEVEELIDKAESRVARNLDLDPNEPFPTESQEAVVDLVALYAAMLVELTKFSEQIARGVSPYPYLKELFDEQLVELKVDVLGIAASTPASEVIPWDRVAVGSRDPVWYFPEDQGGMITYGTQF